MSKGRIPLKPATRRAVMDRDGGMCQLRYPGTWAVRVRGADGQWVLAERRCMGVAEHVHHTLGTHTGNDMRYLVAACGPCNRRAGDPTAHPNPRPVLGTLT